MNKEIKAVISTIKIKKYLLIALLSAMVLGFVSFFLPYFILQNNSLIYQLSFLGFRGIFPIVLFIVLAGLAIALHFRVFLERKALGNIVTTTGTGFIGSAGAFVAGIVCPSCLITLVSLIGLGASTAAFFYSHKIEMMILSFFVLSASIFLASKKLAEFSSSKKSCCNF